ncbi:MAG TPA: phosphotransferase [Bacteroidales bacterium]|nr:phosphotransferase [Bacteroidales bacterium]
MDIESLVIKKFREFTRNEPTKIVNLPLSGSERLYFRITYDIRSVIGVFNPGKEENEAFIGFTDHFGSLDLPVPEMLRYYPEENVYFIQDLGDTNLFTWLVNNRQDPDFEKKLVTLYKKVLTKLLLFQIEGIKNLDMELCYPHRTFDRQSMMWDMNYFKYMFLKLVAAPFNEKRMERDFNTLADFLLEAGSDYFLYRDFQSANIMIINDEPWFIDYQGGRGGAPQYDPASLLFDAKALLPQSIRDLLIEYYVDEFTRVTGQDTLWFRLYYPAFCLIRIMQALGAYGFRGLVERKPGFADSIIPAVRDILWIISGEKLGVELPELFSIIESIPGLPRYKNLKDKGI